MNALPSRPFISVVIPVYNGGDGFRQCLTGLASTTYAQWEAIVVDDGSTDGSDGLAREFGFKVVSSPAPQGGPAIARNEGAKVAKGEILFFVDADVVIRPGTLTQVAHNFTHHPTISACFGSYDDQPADPNFLSQYKNLQHHYVHQTAQEEASTFWSGCGAIRRDVFLEMNGFTTRYGRPCIEDIELGYRLRAAGYSIRLDKALQVTHLKRWTPRNLLITDIRDRALPWSDLILDANHVINDLNVDTGQRLSTVAVFLGLGTLVTALKYRWTILITLLAIPALLTLNRPFYTFLTQKRGAWFTLRSLAWHWLYFLYSGLSFGFTLINKRFFGRGV